MEDLFTMICVGKLASVFQYQGELRGGREDQLTDISRS